MKPTEAAALLTICAAYDNRKPDPDAAKAWAMALDGLRFEDCRDAVVQHYRVSREWIMPADVIAAVKKVRGGRIEDVALSPPPGLDPDRTGDYAQWLEVTRRQVANGEPVTNPEYPATRHIGELRTVLRSVPPIVALPPTKTAEHQAGMARAKAELAARPEVPVAGDELTAEDLTEPAPAPATEQGTEASEGVGRHG